MEINEGSARVSWYKTQLQQREMEIEVGSARAHTIYILIRQSRTVQSEFCQDNLDNSETVHKIHMAMSFIIHSF